MFKSVFSFVIVIYVLVVFCNKCKMSKLKIHYLEVYFKPICVNGPKNEISMMCN